MYQLILSNFDYKKKARKITFIYALNMGGGLVDYDEKYLESCPYLLYFVKIGELDKQCAHHIELHVVLECSDISDN